MGWTMFYLFVALKIPILLLFWLVWWAVHQVPEAADEPAGEGGTRRPPHPRQPLPRTPRRGPHGDPQPTPPPRVRTVTAQGRPLKR